MSSITDHKRRLYISGIAIWSSLSATFGSSIFSPAAVGVDREFHVGTEVGTLGVSLFVLGYAFGPVVRTTFPFCLEFPFKFLPLHSYVTAFNL
jgi:hypothetical protein